MKWVEAWCLLDYRGGDCGYCCGWVDGYDGDVVRIRVDRVWIGVVVGHIYREI